MDTRRELKQSIFLNNSGFFNKATEDSMFSNVLDLLFNCACFIYIGAIIPFSEFQSVHTSVSKLPSPRFALLKPTDVLIVLIRFRSGDCLS